MHYSRKCWCLTSENWWPFCQLQMQSEVNYMDSCRESELRFLPFLPVCPRFIFSVFKEIQLLTTIEWPCNANCFFFQNSDLQGQLQNSTIKHLIYKTDLLLALVFWCNIKVVKLCKVFWSRVWLFSNSGLIALHWSKVTRLISLETSVWIWGKAQCPKSLRVHLKDRPISRLTKVALPLFKS